MQKDNIQQLKAGIICSGLTFLEWEARCIEHLINLKNVNIVLLIINAQQPIQQSRWGVFNKLRKIQSKHLLFNIHNKLLPPQSTQSRCLKNKFKNVPVIRHIATTKGNFSQNFKKEDLKAIQQHNLDFILQFRPNIICEEVLTLAKYGVWSFHHGDEDKYRGEPPCFWEIYEGDKLTGFILKRFIDIDESIVLKKGFVKTYNYSYRWNLDQVLFKSAILPAQVCLDILNDQADYISVSPFTTKNE